ncbi:hypothetical protein AALO_G00166870 [Alosa alosa]|uniref:Uncharacterized protein n=1 Tax=Alosa alosa TaxID=278164 RepID=A0AAV6GID2_9TELE|nr:hypothetical protein AALO_G00166870 [Alosa alosa]
MLLVCLIHYVSKEQEWAGNRNALLKTWPTNWSIHKALVKEVHKPLCFKMDGNSSLINHQIELRWLSFGDTPGW